MARPCWSFWRSVPSSRFFCCASSPGCRGSSSLPPLDRDESRFAQASKQMIESGNYVDIRYSVGPRYKKPVGIYWLEAASTLAFSKPPYNEIWTYRLPSLIGASWRCFWPSGARARSRHHRRRCVGRSLDRLHRGTHRRNQDRENRCGAARNQFWARRRCCCDLISPHATHPAHRRASAWHLRDGPHSDAVC